MWHVAPHTNTNTNSTSLNVFQTAHFILYNSQEGATIAQNKTNQALANVSQTGQMAVPTGR